MSLWKSLMVCRSRFYPYPPFVEAMEERTLLSFLPAAVYAVGTVPDPSTVALGDFNSDGHLDLAVANSGMSDNPGSTLSILLGKSDGTFQDAQSYAVDAGPDAHPTFVAVGDFNGDGHLDVAVADYVTVSILVGNGDGSFQVAQTYAVPAYSVAVGDFNGDGILDFAISNDIHPNGTVGILLGNGDGSFHADQSYATGSNPASIALGDFNGDGHPDLAVGCEEGTLSVLLGNGDGTFQDAQGYDGGRSRGGAYSVAVADFNGDGSPDLAIANHFFGGTVSVLLGKSDGTFKDAQSYLVGAGPFSGPHSVAVADFDGDGHLDLAVVATDGTLSVLLGNGDGTFQDAQIFDTHSGMTGAWSGVTGDFNGDGFPDVAVTNLSNDVSILLNDGAWNGPGAAPPRSAALRQPVLDQLQIETVAAPTAASKLEAQQPLSVAFTDLQAHAVRPSTEYSQPARAQATIASRPMLTARHVQDAVFERWGDGVLDVLEVKAKPPSGEVNG
jgi:hypothetical protein